MTKKVKVFLALLLIMALAGMGYTFHDAGSVMKIGRALQSLGSFSNAQQDTAGLAAPHYIIAGDGTYEYKITDRNLELPEEIILSGAADSTEYASFLAAMNSIFSSGTAPQLVDEEAEVSIRESFSKYSMTAVFEYEVPLAEYLKFNNIDTRSAGQMSGISRITVFEDGSAALYDRHNRNYYRVPAVSSEGNQLQETLRSLIQYAFENTDSAQSRMQSITSMTGVENSTMMPAAAVITLGNTEFVSEFNPDEAADMDLVKTGFFPDGMDFVNTIAQTDGSRILMYGIGKQVLKFNRDGKLIYSREFNPGEYKQCGLYESLKYVASFIETSGGQTEIFQQLDLYINQVTSITEKGCAGYRIDFGASKDGMEIMYDNAPLLSVDVFGSQIISCTRNLPDLSEANVLESPVNALNGTDLIKNNSDTIAAVILEVCSEDSSVNTEKYSANDNFYAVASSISDTRLGLVRLENLPADAEGAGGEGQAEAGENEGAGPGSQFVPAWYLLVDGVEFWFNAENGSLLSYHKQ